MTPRSWTVKERWTLEGGRIALLLSNGLGEYKTALRTGNLIAVWCHGSLIQARNQIRFWALGRAAWA